MHIFKFDWNLIVSIKITIIFKIKNNKYKTQSAVL